MYHVNPVNIYLNVYHIRYAEKAIKLTDEVYNLLETMGVIKHETYNDIIKRTVQHYLSCQVGKKSTTTGSG